MKQVIILSDFLLTLGLTPTLPVVPPKKKRKKNPSESMSHSESENELPVTKSSHSKAGNVKNKGKANNSRCSENSSDSDKGASDSPGKGKSDSGKNNRGKEKRSGKSDRTVTPKGKFTLPSKQGKSSKKQTVESSSEDGLMSMWTEKRPTPNMDYNESNAKCPLPGCDSKGAYLLYSAGFTITFKNIFHLPQFLQVSDIEDDH